MLVIVDAMNVLGSRPDGWWRDRDGALRRLVAEVVVWAATVDDDVLVVADGYPVADLPPGRHGRVEVEYAQRPGPDGADGRIVEVVAERTADGHAGAAGAADGPIGAAVGADGPGGAVTVVTADRALRERVEALGSHVRGPRWLLAELA